MKTLDEYQKQTKKLAEKFGFKWSNYVQYIHLVEEVAELGEALTVHQGDRKAGSGETALADHTSIEEEIGDILFNILEISNQLNVDASAILEKTFERYQEKLNRLKKV